jgi:arsenite-transporting ATPase
MLELLNRQFLFVGGKGGVGKTTTAAALALMAVEHQQRCLLVSTDPAHSLGDLFGREIGDRKTPLLPGLHAVEIDPELTAERYIESVKSTMRDLVRPALYSGIDQQMEISRQAPGTAESAMLDRMTELMTDASNPYDLVIFDTAPTGHTLRLLGLPGIMSSWTDGLLAHQERSDRFAKVAKLLGHGSHSGNDLSYLSDPTSPARTRGNKLRKILEGRRIKLDNAGKILRDEQRCAFVLVTIPERLAVLESRKTLKSLGEYKMRIGALVINQLLPTDLGSEFMESRRKQQLKYIDQIEQDFKSIRRFYLPLQAEDIYGIERLRWIGRHLIAQPYAS